MTTPDIVIKPSAPLRIAEASAIAQTPGPDSVGPIFRQLIPLVLGVLEHHGIHPGMTVGYYENLGDDGIVVHVGFEIAPEAVITDADGVTAVDLAVVTVASTLHHGSLDTLPDGIEQLTRWVQDSGRTMAGRTRELYLQFSETDAAGNVTELQIVLVD